MSQFANFIQAQLASSLAASATEAVVEAASVGDLPVDPKAEAQRLLLIDDVRRPTAFEIISYEAVESASTGLLLKHLTRGLEGTADASWSEGTVATNDLFAAQLAPLHATDAGDDKVLGYVAGGGLELRQVSVEQLGSLPLERPVLFGNDTFSNPPTGQVRVFYDAGTGLVAIFDSGAAQVITASK